jgi:hypothetical protein
VAAPQSSITAVRKSAQYLNWDITVVSDHSFGSDTSGRRGGVLLFHEPSGQPSDYQMTDTEGDVPQDANMEDRARQDEWLVVRCQLGERPAFEALIERWHAPL